MNEIGRAATTQMAPILLKIGGYRHRSKIAAFDYDWTLIKPRGGRRFPKDVDDWEWLRNGVKEKLQEWYGKGWGIVVFTNQSKPWKVDQIRKAMESVGVPLMVAIAMQKEEHKPSRAMWDAVVGGKKLDLAKSFFAGDALGRVSDWSNTDRLFAEAVGVRAVGPEEAFPVERREAEAGVRVLPGQELVIMVGYPGSGKSTVADRLVAEGEGRYVALRGDELKTPARMVRALREAIADEKSPIVDATNPTREGRTNYIQAARDMDVKKVRCVWVKTSLEDSMARNAGRQAEGKPVVPPVVYYTYRKRFEEPKAAEDGCEVVVLEG